MLRTKIEGCLIQHRGDIPSFKLTFAQEKSKYIFFQQKPRSTLKWTTILHSMHSFRPYNTIRSIRIDIYMALMQTRIEHLIKINKTVFKKALETEFRYTFNFAPTMNILNILTFMYPLLTHKKVLCFLPNVYSYNSLTI